MTLQDVTEHEIAGGWGADENLPGRGVRPEIGGPRVVPDALQEMGKHGRSDDEEADGANPDSAQRALLVNGQQDRDVLDLAGSENAGLWEVHAELDSELLGTSVGVRDDNRPDPRGTDPGSSLPSSRMRQPRPSRASNNRGERTATGRGQDPLSSGASAERLQPVPAAQDGASRVSNVQERGGPQAQAQEVDWGPYAHAIAVAEAVLGRPAPPPVRYDGRNGKPRLNPALPEWMMSWEPGWVTDPAIWEGSGMTPNQIRNAELKAIGNGVATSSAVLALRHLLSRDGVPSVD